jgi:hypothetical protein
MVNLRKAGVDLILRGEQNTAYLLMSVAPHPVQQCSVTVSPLFMLFTW